MSEVGSWTVAVKTEGDFEEGEEVEESSPFVEVAREAPFEGLGTANCCLTLWAADPPPDPQVRPLPAFFDVAPSEGNADSSEMSTARLGVGAATAASCLAT